MTRNEFWKADNLIDRISNINESLKNIECTHNINIQYKGCIISAKSTATDVPIYQITLDEKILETIRDKSKAELLAKKAIMEKKLSDLGITIEDWE